MKKTLVLSMLAVFLMASQNAFAQTSEVEPNDDFASAQVLASGELVVTGALAPDVFDTTLTEVQDFAANSMVAGQYNVFNISGLTAGATHAVEVYDNGGGTFDTHMRQYDTLITTSAPMTPAGSVLSFDDDDGAGLFSLIDDADASASGELHIAVTGWADRNTYDGSHAVAGDFGLRVSEVESVLLEDGGAADFYKFSGLTAGGEYTATTASFNGGTPDTIMGLYDATGTQIDFDDDGAATGLFSEFTFTADASGMAWIAVSGFEGFGDTDFSGNYTTSGEYSLSLVLNVPEPGSMVVLGLVGLAGLVRRKRA